MGSDNEGKMKGNGMPDMDANQTGGSGLPVRTKVILLYKLFSLAECFYLLWR